MVNDMILVDIRSKTLISASWISEPSNTPQPERLKKRESKCGVAEGKGENTLQKQF